MTDLTDPRLVLFDRLSKAAQERDAAGLIWTAGKTVNGQPGVIVTYPGKEVAAQIEIVWYGPGGSIYHVPASALPPEYRLMFVRVDRHNICFPNEVACVSGDPEKILDTLDAWRREVPSTYSREGAPIGDGALKALKNLAAAREAASADSSFVQVDQDAMAFAGWSEADVAEARRRIAREFPREDDGRLPLGAALLLAPVEEAGNELLRKPWLAAIGPLKRRDAQTVSVRIEPLIPANHPHRLDHVPGVWNPKVASLILAARWGVDKLNVSMLGLKDRDATIARLKTLMTTPLVTAADRAALCILLQDAGRFGEALALYDVQANNDVWRVASGGMLHSGLEKEQAAWTAAVQEALRSCAPWMLTPLTEKVKGKKAPRHRLFALPHQTGASKTSLMIVTNERGRPQFEFEGTGSMMRLAESRWKRNVEIDLLRFGLE